MTLTGRKPQGTPTLLLLCGRTDLVKRSHANGKLRTDEAKVLTAGMERLADPSLEMLAATMQAPRSTGRPRRRE